MRRLLMILAFIYCRSASQGQELYPIAEPASSVPKNVLGVRVFTEGYNDQGIIRSMSGLKLQYGVTPRLSVYLSAAFADYHQRTLPFDFISHSHTGGQTTGGINTPAAGTAYPYIFNGMDLYAKYRFLTNDGPNTHFRMAAYAEAARTNTPSHVSEPELFTHNSGLAAGVISTYLKKHFAASLTAGGILPSVYAGNSYDIFGGIYPTTVHYGNAVNYSLSLGYLLLPFNYTGYTQTNLNLYIELTGKTYGAATVAQRDGPAPDALSIPINTNTPILLGDSYVDINPGAQCIFNSIYRADLSVALPLIHQSYMHQYPLIRLAVQRYLYPADRHKTATSEKSDNLVQ